MSSDLKLAEQVAMKFHSGQMYGTDSYHVHLADVEAMVKHMNEDDDRLPVIAWLHDVLEDTPCTEEILFALFDDDVVKAVITMTKGFYSKSETTEAYLIRCKSNPLARQVKMADSFCNLRASMRRADMKRIAKYGKNLEFLAS